MKLTDIIDHILLETGEFIVGDISDINLDIKKFWLMTKRSLFYYQKHKPLTRTLQLYIPVSPYLFNEEDKPSWISRVYPTGVTSNFWFLNAATRGEQIPVIWRYEDSTGQLFISNATQVEALAHYNYKFELEYVDENADPKVLKDVNFPEIDESDYKLLTHIKGNFMMALGRSRRAFTAQDFPIQMDSSELVSEGQTIVQEIESSISETNSWFYAIGG